MNLSEKIKYVREYQKLNQEDFARPVGVSGRMMREYEKGKYPVPSDILERLIQEYKIQPNWLFLDIGDPFLTQEIAKNFVDSLRDKYNISEEVEKEIELLLEKSLRNEATRKALVGLVSTRNKETFKDLGEIFIGLSE